MKADDKKLKPCPFCGGMAHFYDDPDGSNMYYVECAECVIHTCWGDVERVQAVWNKRTDGGKTK